MKTLSSINVQFVERRYHSFFTKSLKSGDCEMRCERTIKLFTAPAMKIGR